MARKLSFSDNNQTKHPMKRINLLFVMSILSVSMLFGQKSLQEEVNANLQNLPFPTFAITVPTFPDKTFNIVDAGAIGNGLVKNTQAINSTIEKCSKAGGGKVVIPAGLWLTGPIYMQSNVNLFLAEGAIVVFSADLNDYPLKDDNGKLSVPNLINGSGLENVAVTGSGIFNGDGQLWRMVKKEKMNEKQWKNLIKTGEISADGKIWYPRVGTIAGMAILETKKAEELTQADKDQIKISLRPYMFAVEKTKNLLVQGVTFKNSPKFAMYAKGNTSFVMHKVNVVNEWWMQNADGLDISVCKNVLYLDCTVDTGDDGICMKSGNSKNGEFNMENIVIKNCKVYHGHGGFVIGSNTDGNMRNIYVNNCSFDGTDCGLRIKSGTGRGGRVTNIFCEDIYMKNIGDAAIEFELVYEDKGAVATKDAKIENQKIPDFDGFSFKNIFCDGAKNAMLIGGGENAHVKNVTLQNSVIKSTEGLKAAYSENIIMDNVNIITKIGPAYNLNKANGFTFKNIKEVPATGSYIKVLEEASKKIVIENSAIKATQVEMLNNASPKELIIK